MTLSFSKVIFVQRKNFILILKECLFRIIDSGYHRKGKLSKIPEIFTANMKIASRLTHIM